MARGQPTDTELHDQLNVARLQLRKFEPEPWPLTDYATDRPPTTPSQWFSKKFQEQARNYGCPFIEMVQKQTDGLEKVNPLAPNFDFLAAILGGDKSMGHKVIYLESECQFYYFDPRDRIFKPTSEAKLGNLLRAYLIRCAEELPDAIVHKLNLFLDFRSDKTIRAVIHRAKSILAADSTFFDIESKHERMQGPEIQERVARVFAEQVLEREPGKILPLTTAYLVFCEYLKLKKMPTVRRGVFKDMISPIVRDVFDLGLRNDIFDPVTNNQTAGWKGLRPVDLEEELMAKGNS